jgi:hypothetical protein
MTRTIVNVVGAAAGLRIVIVPTAKTGALGTLRAAPRVA